MIPARNAEKTIQQSVKSVLNQDFKNIEVIVVVNGCSDDTEGALHAIEDDRIKIATSGPGIVSALNTGLMLSRGKYIARQDADDEWLAGKLRNQISVLEYGDLDVLGTQMIICEGENEKSTEYPLTNTQIISCILRGSNPIGHPSVVFRRSVLDKVGGYWEMFPLAEDLDMWARMIPHVRFGNLTESHVRYNFTPNPSYNPSVPRLLAQHYSSLYGVNR